MISLVICTMGNIDFLKQIFSVVFNVEDVKQVIIVDNSAYDNNTMILLNSINNPRLVVIKNKVNQGVIRSRNQGLALSDQYYTLILDDDQIPKKETFSAYLTALKSFDIVGCEAQLMDFRTGLTRLGSEKKFSYVGAGGMCMPTSLWRKLGLFDEIFQPAYFEDPDICIRAKKAKYTIGLVPHHNIHHYGHRTLFRKDLGFCHDKILTRNRAIFLARYGVKPVVKELKRTSVSLSNSNPKVLHILSNLNIGGVQQNAVYIANGLGKFNHALFVAESAKQGSLGTCVNKNVKIIYNRQVSDIATARVYKNVSHGPQSVIDNKGVTRVVKPGGILPDLGGYNLGNIRGFRLDSIAPIEVDVTIVDAVQKYSPDIIHYHRDISRISRDITRLRSMPQFKNLKVARTVHGSRLPDLNNYNTAVVLTKVAVKGAKKRYPKVNAIFIPNGVDNNVFKPIKVKKENVCITHTRLSKILKLTARPELYFDIVSRVCSIDKTVKFILVGPDYNLYKSRFDSFIKRFNLQNKLIIRPPLYNIELATFINKAKVWVYPMREDNFPLSVIEAMLCKLPIVASNLVGISEMIIHEESGLLSLPSDVESFVKNILACLSNSILANRLGEAAYNKAKEAYSLDSMLDRYNNMYLNLMGT